MNEPIIIIKKLSKSYKKTKLRVPVLRGIDLQISEGELLAILGRSGSGKTTLLNLISGLDAPTEGDVTIKGKSWNLLNDRLAALHRQQTIGMVFQFFYLFQDLNILENVLLPTRFGKTKISKSKCTSRAKELIDDMGLSDRLNHLPKELSGGESQRVAIARALINDPPILICDEPTGNLDSETGQQISNYLRDLSLKSKKTILIVTHDDKIARSANRTLYMEDGLIRDDKSKAV